ncbi:MULTISPECIES: SMP-30/gluconolactonase/LRE family protein [unclassified Actinopolyspora]|uniref:SMP-30/gluconolactonase/LRE family protein n=1 Tax=unclassified Actinopolyspora TaxID=2639451 RepID=UPI0013F658ED|nr:MULTISPECIES: SMP-30/gluconolactonase/LRE family protein [unclassified Actinopolyspora]NHD19091.1 SMP-30/gluconolactonase/LRE family protein [Actinopolyspora sp. BKK2]NHE78124.1 SMP-30/gluconolactonase/LRE family protein [Actinopolyspora sp. BKK1]
MTGESAVLQLEAERATEVCAEHGEGPVWDPTTGQLHWVDMLAGELLTMVPGGIIGRTKLGTVAAVARPVVGGGLVLALERGFALLRPGRQTPESLPQLWSDPSIRMNDGGCDALGRFYAGSMAYDESPGKGTLWRLDGALRATRVLDGVTISNGLVWTEDGGTAFYVDTPTGRVDRFDVDEHTGEPHNRRPAVRVPNELGSPDGLALDAEGCLWVALWQGGAVHRYSPDGQLLARVRVPTPQVTACAFGGPRMETLYITTSRQGRDDRDDGSSGALFRVTPGVRGTPVHPFRLEESE